MTDNNTFCGLHEGTMDWPAIIGALRTYGYDGYITAELWADGDVGGGRARHLCGYG